MKQLVLVTPFLLTTLAARAQQPDTLARPATDSLRLISCGATSVTEQINLPAFTTIQPALSRIAGVQVTPYSGAPGAWATVRIRGAGNVTGSSQPLYVVDGVPVYNTDVTPERWDNRNPFYPTKDNSSFPNIATPSALGANPLLDLPVDDVDQIIVLRGAAATAQYGMQGSNGVILISTRQGADGRTQDQPLRVRYSGWGGVQQVRQRYELLNGRQYAQLANAATASSFGRPLPYSTADLSSLQEVDWQDELFRPAAVQSHNLSVDGLAGNTRYYVAADYLNQAGVIVKSGMSRGSLRFNLDQQITQKLRVGVRASASQTNQHHAGQELDAGSLVRSYLLGIPAVPARTSSSYSPPAPRYALDDYSQTARTRRLVTQLNATYQFSPSLSLTARGSREKVDAEGLDYTPNGFGPGPVPVERTGTATTLAHNWVVAATLRFERTFREQHAVTAALNYLRQQDQRELEYTYEGMYSGGFLRSEEKRLAIHSPSVVAAYTYAGRYEAQASMRTEFASGENASDKKVWLPGGQLSWHINKERFLADHPRLTDLTLWAGSGKTSSFFVTDRTTQHDAGLRAGLLGGSLTLEVAAYQRRTSHSQASFLALVPTTIGIINLPTFPNITLLNKGLELTVGGSWQVGPVRGFSQLSAATNRNEVTELNPGDDFGRTVPSNLEVGQPVSRFRVYEADGTFPVGHPSAGQQRYADRNNDGHRDFGDIYYEGTGLPRYSLNFSQQLRLKHFQLDAQFDGLFGYQIQNSTLLRLDAPSGFANSSVRALNYWTPANQDTSVPRPGFANFSSPVPTNEDLENGSHVRLSQLTLSYEVLNTGPRKVSVWVGGQNLFVTGPYRGFDPNVSSGGAGPYYAGQDAGVYPVARMWQLGLRGQF
ncbi:TonB-dependent receptor plug domain-containing protein [Hymenobacter cellulosivorans]|uniref:TonB-dependent receptor plug domain-containing protein n=1 Tax=Hymenobacter cellulosivorans TaxID=2932249 RepID=A0ABY4FC60_9BACT|nr:TonB-dependent receptor plug domain-containing protein [Hymenobacter cellulosivorans]UOQ53746.1 TonB-dependent receptor plug domain-containing protein [Hymenobacter cellulosivorans]